MAWHSGKPADSDFLSASVQHIRENFAELEPLHPHIAELVDLTALHPHIAALLDSRIVEMGSNANGQYVRWENGLQVCRWVESAVHSHPNAAGPIYRSDVITWTYPALFVSPPVVVAGANNFTWASASSIGLSSSGLISFSSADSGRQSFINAVAIGRWK